MKTAQIIVRYLSPAIPACSVEIGDYDIENSFTPFEDYRSWCEEFCPLLLDVVNFDDSLGTKAWISSSKFPVLFEAVRSMYPNHSMAFYPGYVVFYVVMSEDDEN